MAVTTRSRARAADNLNTNQTEASAAPVDAAVCADTSRGAASDRASAAGRAAKTTGALKRKIHTESDPTSTGSPSIDTLAADFPSHGRKRVRLDVQPREDPQDGSHASSPQNEPTITDSGTFSKYSKKSGTSGPYRRRGCGWTHRKQKNVRARARVVVVHHERINQFNERYADEVDAMLMFFVLKGQDKVDESAVGILEAEKVRVEKLEALTNTKHDEKGKENEDETTRDPGPSQPSQTLVQGVEEDDN